MVIWKGQWYYRRRDKNWRNRHSGKIVVGTPVKLIKNNALGYEVTGAHRYGSDPHRLKETKKLRKILKNRGVGT